jgi:hypothetical protein
MKMYAGDEILEVHFIFRNILPNSDLQFAIKTQQNVVHVSALSNTDCNQNGARLFP